MIVNPSDNLQAIIDRSPEGEVFEFAEGNYVLAAPLKPRTLQKFVGSPGVVLIGSGPAPIAFDADHAGVAVEIHDLTMEGFKPLQQCGVVGGGNPSGDPGYMSHWLIENCEIRYSAWRGASAGSHTTIRGCYIHHCGDLGIGGQGVGIRIIGNELAFNNTKTAPGSGQDVTWEAGGAKFTNCEDLQIVGNDVHDNTGPGLWMDIECRGVSIEHNHVYNNSNGGITHEISYQCRIAHNVVECNLGAAGPDGKPSPWWGAQILVNTSQDVEIVENRVTVGPASAGNAILIQQQLRQGAAKTYLAQNVYAHHNRVTHEALIGCSGLLCDQADPELTAFLTTRGNLFDRNSYTVTDPNAYHWAIGGPNPGRQWSGWKAAGMDAKGSIAKS